MPPLISVNEADKLLVQHLREASAITCPLDKAAGRVLMQNIQADRDLPPFDRCMLDGYAVRAEGVAPGARFRITGRVHAGEGTAKLLPEPDAAIEVMTGSVLPPGADAVIRYEDTQRDGNTFAYTAKEPLEAEEGVHRQASDYPQGTTLLKAGTLIGPVEIGIIASCGVPEPLCAQLPRITIFGTGDELVPVSATPEPHQIRQSNLHAIECALTCAGYNAAHSETLTDDRASQEPRLADAIEQSDVVIISGAVSKGRKDWIPEALDRLSQKVFHGVAQRPGKPMGFWKNKDGPAIFGLPGNPVSTLVTTHRYVLPYLDACLGKPRKNVCEVALADNYEFAAPITLFLPVRLAQSGDALPCPLQNSGDYARLAGTDGFVELPADQSSWPSGTSLPYTPWQR